MKTPSPFQLEDVNAVLAAHESHRCVLGRAATGLGKAFELAMLAAHYQQFGQVLVLVDVRTLVRQLAEEIGDYTGVEPGVEMGDERANHGGYFCQPDRVVISTVQSQYSGGKGRERYRRFDPKKISCLLLDECELFLADCAGEVVKYYLDGNPDLKVFGCTATPMRTDDRAMADLFEHVAFDRDIEYGVSEGWLVEPRQGFVRVNIDPSTAKLSRGPDGETDFSEADLSARLAEEGRLIELAKGIIGAVGDRKSIVVCPARDRGSKTSIVKGVADYLDAERPGCARYVIGEMDDDDKDAVMAAHKRGEFQFLVSCMMLTKGYNDPTIGAVVNCRRTKSKRLYTQIVGRGTRPHTSIVRELFAAPTAEARRAIIAASVKPRVLMVNLVGIRPDVRDMTIVDILGKAAEPAVNDRAKELVAENHDMEVADAVAEAQSERELDQAAERVRAEQAALELDMADAENARARSRIRVDADVQVEWQDDARVGAADAGGPGHASGDIDPRYLRIIRDQAKFPPEVVARLGPDDAKALAVRISIRRKQGLVWSYKMSKVLERAGYTKGELRSMTMDAASRAIDAAKQNNWRRADAPTTEAA